MGMDNKLRDKLVELLAITSLEFEDAVTLANYLIRNGITIPVRCKDCKSRHTEDCLMQYTDYSEDMDANPEGISVEWCEDNDFCSYGERKEHDGKV